MAIARMETEEAQDAQVVLRDALFRITDKDDAAALHVRPAIDEIMHRAMLIAVERVHGEVAPLRIGVPVVGEPDLGAAAVGLHVMAQRGDFEGMVIDHHRHRAMLDAGGMNLHGSGSAGRRHLCGRQGGGDIDLRHGFAQQCIAHRTARHAALAACCRQRGEQALQRGLIEPRFCGKGGKLGHVGSYIRR